MVVAVTPGETGREAGLELLVLTQNIWGGAPGWPRRRDRLARRIEQFRPDIIGLQEVHAPAPGGEESQAHELARLLGGYEVAFAAGCTGSSGACEGVAILSRWAIRERSSASLSQDAGDRLDRIGRRVVLRATIDRGGPAIDLFATHLSISRPSRARTVPELIAFAAGGRQARGAVLLGDLNATPQEPSILALEADGWLDAWTAANGRGPGGATWPSFAPFRRIDYVLVKSPLPWRVVSCLREPPSGSDHLGVVARLTLCPGPSQDSPPPRRPASAAPTRGRARKPDDRGRSLEGSAGQE